MQAAAHLRRIPLWVFVWGSVLLWSLAGCSSAPTARHMYPPGYPIGHVERGAASWYGPGFHGNRTANGEVYDMHKFTAAHRTLPLGSLAVVRSLTTGREVTVRINDRGPFAKGRILDLSLAGAQSLGMTGKGTDEVEIRVVGYHGRPGELGFLRVQVGSFADAANARAVVDRLKDRRYQDARILVVELPEGRRYRVQVGRYTTESQAETAATHLAAQLNLDPFVVRDDS